MRHPSKIIESMFLSGLIVFVLAGMSGVSIRDSAALSLLIAIQVSGGVALWYTVNDFQPIQIPESIGMGLALGSSITTISQFLLRETVISNYSWAVPLIFLIPLIKHSKKTSFLENKVDTSRKLNEERFSMITIFALLTLALATLWWWLYPMSIAMFLVSVIKYQKLKNKTLQRSFSYICIFVSISGFFASLILSHQNDFWKVISNDQVFSESLSWSLFNWGNNDSPFAAGTPISYHWFVLLWSGITSSATNAQSWVVITRVIPIISFLGIFCLTWKMTWGIYKKYSAPIFSSLFLIFYSNNFYLSFTRAMASSTFLLSCVWLLAFANSIFAFYRKPSLKVVFLSSFLLFMTFGGKVMNGAIGMSAMLFALLIWFLAKNSKTNRLMILILVMISLISLVLIYFVMYNNNQPGNVNTLITRSLIPIQLGLLPPDKDGLYLFLGNLFVFTSMMLPLVATSIYATKRIFRFKFEVWFIVGSIISALILSFMTSHPGVSQLYFWSASLVFVSILTPAVFYDGITPKFKLSALLPSTLIVLAAAFVSTFIWDRSTLEQTLFGATRLKLIALSVGLASVLTLTTVFNLSFKKLIGENFRFKHSLLLGIFILFNLGLGVNQQVENFVNRSQTEMSDPDNHDLITGSLDHLEILNWIRANTERSDVVATNRFCIPGIGYCISKWQLVSAVSHRRMLFEGGYYELPSIPDQELLNRYVLSSDFGINPSPIGLRRMCDYGVKWYFYDHSVAQPLDTWEPYAVIQLQNQGVSLLRLTCPIS